MEEKWLPVPNYEGLYEVSNTGKVRSVTRTVIFKNGNTRTFYSKELKQTLSKGNNYLKVNLSKDGKVNTYRVHRLVAEVFIPNPNNYDCVNHKDENKLNNNVDNLEWCTKEYNNNYGTRNENVSNSLKKPIAMCDKDTHQIIKIFDSRKEAGEFFNSPFLPTNISAVLNGRAKTAHGYWWKNLEENIDNN